LYKTAKIKEFPSLIELPIGWSFWHRTYGLLQSCLPLTKNCRCPKNRRQILTLPPTVVNPHNILSLLQITDGVAAKIWQDCTWQGADFRCRARQNCHRPKLSRRH